MKIWFDMDGTIVDLYGVRNWLTMVDNEDPTPYTIAKPCINLSRLAYYINKLQRKGHQVGIISWTSKTGSDLYNGQVTLEKLVWLKQHMPSVVWDSIKIMPYGTDKYKICKSGILFDDEAKNRENWQDQAYAPAKIFEILMAL